MLRIDSEWPWVITLPPFDLTSAELNCSSALADKRRIIRLETA